jgi:ABC-type sulfate transport system permease component
MNLSLAVTLSVILVGFAFLALLLVKLLYARVSDEP